MFSFYANAQSKIILKGKLIDKETSKPIEDATVYITTVKDSTMMNYSVSDKNGVFKIETKKITVPFFLKIAATGYQNHQIKENSGTENKDFGVLSILNKQIELSEVVIKNEAPPVKIKKDTLEFNAASFKVRPDANVEALIRQLPGAQIDENKTITINGKVVDKILVNGKPFFNEDGKIAIQNLSADMVKKVQVSNTKTKEEEMTKQDSSSNTSTLNLTLKEDKNKGVFGKFMGGYGTDDRYESSGIASYFKNKRRITAIFSSNNINATGFSMDDVFDNMGGGRNNGGMRFMGGGGGNSTPTGITRSTTAGLNYDDEWIKDLSAHTSYNYKNLDNENRNKTSRAEFLPTGNIFTESESASNQLTEGHNLATEFQYKINDKTNIYLNPSFAKTTTTSNSAYQASSRDDNNDLMNENSGISNSHSDSENFQNWMGFFRSFKKKGRYFNASLQNNNSRNEANSISNSATLFYQDATPDDIRNQNVLSERANDNFYLNLSYSEPITDSLSLSVGVRTNWSKSIDDTDTFDFDAATGRYSDKNELRSNYFETKSTRISPTAGLIIRKKKLNLWASLGTYFVEADNHSDYLNTKTNLSKNYALPEANVNFNYNFSKTKNVRAYYYRGYSLPSAQQILPVANLSNPLNTYIGNSNLDIGKNHYANFNFGNQNTANLSGYSIYSNANYYDSSIASTSVYDENGKQKTTYVNISGNYNFNFGANWDKTVKKEQNTFKYSFKLNTGYEFQKGFTNAELYTARIKSVSPGVSFSYDYGYFFTLRPSYNFTFRQTDYTNYRIDEASNREHNFKIEATNYIHKQWVLGNDFGYNYNSNISGGFKKDFYLWNASLSYKTKEDQWIFKVKVYDILDQNQSATRNISATSVTDSQNTVLKRYGMFSITYKFKKFGMKLEEEKAPEKAAEKVPVKAPEKK
ncbi:Outer membrane protein beta-barrel family protein [Flavobacterium fluvii]|uniref:Outer membrane protein beta-barrel family protein n=1 Tax=Flavobacterium fluvii TaxID=468056 RepID=A0A1M5H8Q4_9FLAO|nr:Outer membrane protein beta-barrel family protein [Flavobacterium fluvii]